MAACRRAVWFRSPQPRPRRHASIYESQSRIRLPILRTARTRSGALSMSTSADLGDRPAAASIGSGRGWRSPLDHYLPLSRLGPQDPREYTPQDDCNLLTPRLTPKSYGFIRLQRTPWTPQGRVSKAISQRGRAWTMCTRTLNLLVEALACGDNSRGLLQMREVTNRRIHRRAREHER